MAGFTFACESLNHLFSTLAARCRRDFASSEEFRIVCLHGFRGTSATFILPTCPVTFPNLSVSFNTVWLPHFSNLDVFTVPDRSRIDPFSTYSASCPLTTRVVNIDTQGGMHACDRRTRTLSVPPRKDPGPEQLHFEVASFVLIRASCLQSGSVRN